MKALDWRVMQEGEVRFAVHVYAPPSSPLMSETISTLLKCDLKKSLHSCTSKQTYNNARFGFSPPTLNKLVYHHTNPVWKSGIPFLYHWYVVGVGLTRHLLWQSQLWFNLSWLLWPDFSIRVSVFTITVQLVVRYAIGCSLGQKLLIITQEYSW